MNGPVQTLAEQEAPERPVGAGGHDRLLDIVRGIAIVRVVLWHTWSWAWLSWIPAMPAMFFTSGALLERSLARRGWLMTVRQRLRRLMIPYWLYAAACWIVMLADGWRPTLWQGATWLVPLGDPIGSADMPGLWVPLWYIRAYIWFVLGSGVIRLLQRRLGSIALGMSSLWVVGVWWMSLRGHDIPMALGDAIAYLPFVMAGMAYSSRGLSADVSRSSSRSGRDPTQASRLIWLAVAALASSFWVVQRFGPDDKIVNRSYLLTLLVGTAGIAAMVAFRSASVAAVTSRPKLDAAIKKVNSHALTIYLWQGFGLVAAQRLVELRIENPILEAVLGLLVVVTVIAGAVILFGWVEDWAARKPTKRPNLRGLAFSVTPVAVLVVALLVPVPGDAEIEAPLSGRAVVARAGLVEDSLNAPEDRAQVDTEPKPTSADTVLNEWVAANGEVLDRIGTNKIELALLGPDGELQLAKLAPELAVRLSACLRVRRNFCRGQLRRTRLVVDDQVCHRSVDASPR